MANSGVKVDTRQVEKMLNDFAKGLNGKSKGARAGYFDGDSNEDGVSLVKIALANEYGFTAHIPERTTDITTYKSISKSGDYNKKGQFVKKGKSNFAQDFKGVVIPAHDVNVPPRPFLRDAQNNANKRAKNLVKTRLHEGTNVDALCKELAVMLTDEVKKSIRTGNWEANRPSTIRKKHSSKPLIDTGQLLNGAHGAVVLKGGEEAFLPKE